VPPKPYKLFISHASEDTWVARQIERHAKEAGAETFLDYAHIKVGDPFQQVITDAAKECDELLILLTPSALDSLWIGMELGMFQLQAKRVVWVLYGIPMKKLERNRRLSDIIKTANLIGINDLDRYFAELAGRVAR
jgi:hypothetical protein